MRRPILLSVRLLAAALLITAGCYAQEKDNTQMNSNDRVKHVVLISIDSFRPDFYLDPSWDTPHLRKLRQHGVYAHQVSSVFPSVTYPSHTTLVTGALPARHGVYFNAPFQSEKGRWYWEENLIQTTTLWDAVKDAGLRSAAVMWPVSVGAPIDYNFPVKRADKGDSSSQLAVTTPLVTPAGLMDEMQRSFGELNKDDFNTSNTIDVTIAKMANYIIETYQPALTAIHFITVDHQQHGYGRQAVETKEAIHAVDSLIGTVIQTVEKADMHSSTAFIITGDHGMIDVNTTLSPNVWLKEEGLISENDWKAAFNTTGGSAFLYLKDKHDRKTLERVKRLLASRSSEEKTLFRVLDRKELDSAGANKEAALALTMAKGVAANASREAPALKTLEKTRGVHGYLPGFPEIQTGFIAAGTGIRHGTAVDQMGIQDVAPLVAELLQLDFEAPDGRLIPGILEH